MVPCASISYYFYYYYYYYYYYDEARYWAKIGVFPYPTFIQCPS